MPAIGFLKSCYLRFLSKPAPDRQLYSLIRRHQVGSIVELGVGNGQRAKRMIQMAQRYHSSDVRYTGIDLFEARPAAEKGLSLKQAYKEFRATGAKVQLVPGDPLSSLARTANSLTGTQLLVISADQDAQSLEQAWFYVPRMLEPQAIVLQQRIAQDSQKVKYDRLSQFEISKLATANHQRKRAA